MKGYIQNNIRVQFLSDDIVRMWVDGKLCVDDWSCRSAMKHKVCNLSANAHCLYVLAK